MFFLHIKISRGPRGESGQMQVLRKDRKKSRGKEHTNQPAEPDFSNDLRSSVKAHVMQMNGYTVNRRRGSIDLEFRNLPSGAANHGMCASRIDVEVMNGKRCEQRDIKQTRMGVIRWNRDEMMGPHERAGIRNQKTPSFNRWKLPRTLRSKGGRLGT